jgi:hypothetical protein
MSDIITNIHAEGDNVIFNRVQDCMPIVAQVETMRQQGALGDKEMRHAARFPMVIIEKYLNDKGITFQDFMSDQSHIKVMMSDPALAAFRVWEGKV